MRRTLFLSVFAAFFLQTTLIHSHNADHPTRDEKQFITDIITRPLELMLAPVLGQDIARGITGPARILPLQFFDMHTSVVTPSRVSEKTLNINRNVTVITADEIQLSGARNVQDILSRKAGITVNRFLNNAKDTNVDLMGFGETGNMNYLVMIDGRRVNQIDLSGSDLFQVDIGAIQRIEIVKGANSVLYGDNASGGIVNIITKRGDAGYHFSYKQDMGSYGFHRENVSVEGADDFLSYFLNFANESSRGYRANNHLKAKNLFSAITISPVDNFELDLSASYHRDRYGQPGALYPGNIIRDGRQATRFPHDTAGTEDYYFAAIPRSYFEFSGNDLGFSVLAAYRSRRSDSISMGMSNPYEIDHYITSVEIKPKLEIRTFICEWDLKNAFISGVDYFSAKDRVLSGDITLTKQNYHIEKETLGVYVSDSLVFRDRFTFNSGFRGEWANYIFDQFSPDVSYNTKGLRQAAFEIGAGLKYNEFSQFYSNFSTSYRFPGTDEYFTSAYEFVNWFGNVQLVPACLNKDLRQQVGNNIEIGIKDNTIDNVAIKAAYLFIDTRDEIYYDPLVYENRNYANTTRHRIDLELSASVTDDITVFGGYNYQRAFFKGGDYAGNTIPLVPENKIVSGIKAGPFAGFTADMFLSYVGARYAASDQANRAEMIKSHITIDAGISYGFENIRIYGLAKNIFGKKYYSNATKDWQGDLALYPAPERTFEFGVAVSF